MLFGNSDSGGRPSGTAISAGEPPSGMLVTFTSRGAPSSTKWRITVPNLAWSSPLSSYQTSIIGDRT